MFTKKRLILIFLLAAIIIAAPVAASFVRPDGGVSAEEEMSVLTLWQIDSFEGGKGSRAQYLQNKADQFFSGRNCYVITASISAEAARNNFAQGNFPDMISYGAGFYGIEEYVNASDFASKVWCRGGYCLITIDDGADFSDATSDNTVINGGKDNLVSICALLEGLSGAPVEKAVSAYVSLLSGTYKYLLGTQRDIFRLKTRGASFTIKPLTGFNDLYQCVSILATGKKYAQCMEFTEYLTSQNSDIDKIGLFYDGVNLYDDVMRDMENLRFDCTIKSFVSQRYLNEVETAAQSGDINLLKSLLK